MKIIKILNDSNGAKWIEITKEEYTQNWTDRINYLSVADQDTNKINYYRKEVIEVYGREWFERLQGRMGTH